jgi:hypothetical protein
VWFREERLELFASSNFDVVVEHKAFGRADEPPTRLLGSASRADHPREERQTKSIRKIQPAVGLSFTGHPGWMPASQLIRDPSRIASPWGSQEFG